MKVPRTGCLLLLLGGWGVVVGKQVAYHRVCCLQDAPVAIGGEIGIAALEKLIGQFDSEFCVHTFGIRNSGPKKRATHDGPGTFESDYVLPSPAGSKSRPPSNERSGSSSPQGSRSRSPSRSRSNLRSQSNSRSRSNSPSRPKSSSGEPLKLKCATVEVFFDEKDVKDCLLDILTPNYLAKVSLKDPSVHIGTGRATWNGKAIVEYVEDLHLKPATISEISDGVRYWNPNQEQCNSFIDKSMVESTIATLGTSLDAKGFVRFLEYATNSRVPISNIYLRRDGRDVFLTTTKLRTLNIAEVINRLCEEMGLRRGDDDCLKEVPVEKLTPEFEQPLISVGNPSGKTVNLVPLKNGALWEALVEAMGQRFHKRIDSFNCDADQGDKARVLEFVLMRALLAVSGTSYASLHNRAMQKRLSNKKHWMLSACAPERGMKFRKERPIHYAFPFLHDYFAFSFDETPRVAFVEEGTIQDIDTEGIETPVCAVFAGVHDLTDHPEPFHGEVDAWITYFRRGDQGVEILQSVTGRARLWHFFRLDGRLKNVLKRAKSLIPEKKKSPPRKYTYPPTEEEIRERERKEQAKSRVRKRAEACCGGLGRGIGRTIGSCLDYF